MPVARNDVKIQIWHALCWVATACFQPCLTCTRHRKTNRQGLEDKERQNDSTAHIMGTVIFTRTKQKQEDKAVSNTSACKNFCNNLHRIEAKLSTTTDIPGDKQSKITGHSCGRRQTLASYESLIPG